MKKVVNTTLMIIVNLYTIEFYDFKFFNIRFSLNFFYQIIYSNINLDMSNNLYIINENFQIIKIDTCL